MKFIGLDPSLSATAVCVLDSDGTHEMSVFASKPSGTHVHARYDRYWDVVRRTMDVVKVSRCGQVFIEGYSMGARGRAVSAMIEFGWTLRIALNPYAEVIEVPPSCVKKFVTGKGNADKSAVILGVYKRWGLECKTSDEADAYGLAQIAKAYETGECATQQQREVIAVLKGEKRTVRS